MNDDFNSPILIAQLFDAVKYINAVKNGHQQIDENTKKQLFEKMDVFIFEVLGLKKDRQQQPVQNKEQLNDIVELLIDLRNSARDNKDFKTSDQIRDKLKDIGITLKDSKEGTDYFIQ